MRGLPHSGDRREHGTAAVLACVIAASVIALTLGLARVGLAGTARTRVQTAADAAALAAAGELAAGHGAEAAARAAARTAQENGARIRKCRCDGIFALVEVVAPLGRFPLLPHTFSASAQAELRTECPS